MAKSREQYISENSDDYDADLITFSLIDEKTVRRLVKDGDIELPYKDLDKIKDKRWNTKQMSSRLLRGILNGDPIKKIATSLVDITNNNKAATMRNARTMVTGAENRGRLDSYENLSSQGVVQKKVWIATPDDRTRESHLAIDGEEVDIDEPFSNGCMCPGDPNCSDTSEVWNCRCSMRTRIVGFMRSDGSVSQVAGDRGETVHDRQMAEEKERRGVKEEKQEEKEEKREEKEEKTLEQVLDEVQTVNFSLEPDDNSNIIKVPFKVDDKPKDLVDSGIYEDNDYFKFLHNVNELPFEEQYIPLDKIVSIQAIVDKNGVLSSASSKEPVDVVFINGTYYLYNGNHRATAAYYQNKEKIYAKVRMLK